MTLRSLTFASFRPGLHQFFTGGIVLEISFFAFQFLNICPDSVERFTNGERACGNSVENSMLSGMARRADSLARERGANAMFLRLLDRQLCFRLYEGMFTSFLRAKLGSYHYHRCATACL